MVQLSLKLFLNPELSKNRRNSRFSPEKRYFLNFWSCTLYFFMKFGTLMQNGNFQNVMEPDFRKTFFPVENAGNMPEKPVFWHFLEISSLVFSDFLLKDAYQQCPKHGRVRFLKKIFFWPKMLEICRKSPFLQIFVGLFRYISLFFSLKHY